MTASIRTNHAKVATDVQSVVPGTELGLSLIRLANFQPRVPTRNPNTVRGSRQHPVELQILDLQILADPPVPVLASARSPARIPPCAGQPFLSEFTEVARVSGALHTPRAPARGFYPQLTGTTQVGEPMPGAARVQLVRAGRRGDA